MKKLLTILLALLVVTGVVFADEGEGGGGDTPVATVPTGESSKATLTLKSNVIGEFWHGFANTAPTTFDSTLDTIVNYTKTSIDMASITNNLGVYYISTNANLPVNVTFSLEAMHNIVAGVYVPYKLTFGNPTVKTGRFTEVDLSQTTLGEAGVMSTTDPWAGDSAVSGEIITSTAGGGSGTLVVALNAEFLTTNTNLAEGDYVGNIYATIATQ